MDLKDSANLVVGRSDILICDLLCTGRAFMI